MKYSHKYEDKIALIIESLTIDQYERDKKVPCPWNKIKDFSLQVSQIGFAFPKNNYFFKNIDKIMQQLLSTGVIEHLKARYFPKVMKFKTKKNWSVLTFENLEFGFVIWLMFCALCICGFFMELVAKIIEDSIKKKCMKQKYVKIKFAKVHPKVIRTVKVSKSNKQKKVVMVTDYDEKSTENA